MKYLAGALFVITAFTACAEEPVIPTLSLKLLDTQNAKELKVQGAAGDHYRIEVSKDLKRWTVLTSVNLTQETQKLSTGSTFQDSPLFLRGKKAELTPFALITNVTTSGSSGAYTFSVTISSPDTGCEQYADWWEVLKSDGSLVYRRVLGHSHVNEQPFTRSGGRVKVQPDDELTIRAHMNNSGYGNQVFRGSITNGFTSAQISQIFGPEAAVTAPLPSNCAF